jgi:hypothetical protein
MTQICARAGFYSSVGLFCAERADDSGVLTMRPPTEAASVFFLKRLFAVSFSLAQLVFCRVSPPRS